MREGEERYLICEDSLEGIFTGIYEAFALREDRKRIHIQLGEGELRLFAVYTEAPPDTEKVVKVARTIHRRFGEDFYLFLCEALSANDPEKGDAVFHVVEQGLSLNEPAQILNKLTDPAVCRVFELRRSAANEIHQFKEFLRFEELENGILFARIAPKNNIVTFLAPHFADRLPLENFLIYDDTRGIFVVHPASGRWYVVTAWETERMGLDRYSAKESACQELFRFYCHKIAIKERKNLKLQRSMLPLRFQKYMVDFL